MDEKKNKSGEQGMEAERIQVDRNDDDDGSEVVSIHHSRGDCRTCHGKGSMVMFETSSSQPQSVPCHCIGSVARKASRTMAKDETLGFSVDPSGKVAVTVKKKKAPAIGENPPS